MAKGNGDSMPFQGERSSLEPSQRQQPPDAPFPGSDKSLSRPPYCFSHCRCRQPINHRRRQTKQMLCQRGFCWRFGEAQCRDRDLVGDHKQRRPEQAAEAPASGGQVLRHQTVNVARERPEGIMDNRRGFFLLGLSEMMPGGGLSDLVRGLRGRVFFMFRLSFGARIFALLRMSGLISVLFLFVVMASVVFVSIPIRV